MKNSLYAAAAAALLLLAALFLPGYRLPDPELEIELQDAAMKFAKSSDMVPELILAKVKPVTRGTLRKDMVVDLRNRDNIGGSFRVKKILVNDVEKAQLGPGESGTVWLAEEVAGNMEIFINASGNWPFYILNPGATPPGYVDYSQPIDPGPAPAPEPPQLSCTLNGSAWSGSVFFNSCLFYQKGIHNLYEGKPHLTLAFKASQAPDNRQLTLVVTGFAGTTGKCETSTSLEVLLSGSASGIGAEDQLQGVKKGKASTFSLNITRWERVNRDEAVCSGTFSGKLPGVLGSPAVDVQQGRFDGVKVKVFPDAY